MKSGVIIFTHHALGLQSTSKGYCHLNSDPVHKHYP